MKEALLSEVDEKQAVEAGLTMGQENSAPMKFLTRPQGQTPRWDGQSTWPWFPPASDPMTHYMLVIMH